MPQGGDEVVLIVHRLFDARLHGGVNGGVDAQTAGEDQLLRLVGGVVQVLLQLAQQLGVQGIGEPRVAGRAGRVLGGARFFGQGDSLGLGGVELGLGDIPWVYISYSTWLRRLMSSSGFVAGLYFVGFFVMERASRTRPGSDPRHACRNTRWSRPPYRG